MKRLVTTIILFYTSLYIPLAGIIYFTPWYALNTTEETRIYMGEETVKTAHTNLTQFFRHQEELFPDFWSQKEIHHMQDVREIYDILFWIFIASTILALYPSPLAKGRSPRERGVFPPKIAIIRAAKINTFLPLALLFILPFFSYFWSHIFHAALFTNDLWIMAPEDLSYHLFPLDFFTKSLVFIALSASALNFLLYRGIKKRD